MQTDFSAVFFVLWEQYFHFFLFCRSLKSEEIKINVLKAAKPVRKYVRQTLNFPTKARGNKMAIVSNVVNALTSVLKKVAEAAQAVSEAMKYGLQLSGRFFLSAL